MKQQSSSSSPLLRPPPLRVTFPQLLRRLISTPDSVPLVVALCTAATILTSYVAYQFAVRPDFKALRIRSNATPGMDKPIGYYSNRLIWLSKKTVDAPKEVKELSKELHH